MKIYSWRDMDWEVVTEGLRRKIITGVNVMSAQIRLEKDAVVPEHAHPNEQITYVLEGKLQFRIAGETLILNAGQVLVIPPNLAHQVVALEPSLVLDNFSPIRQDWLDHTDTYLQAAPARK